MQVTCPNCGEKVPAENINIQKMTAVCTACDTVFVFEPPEAKSKRRKSKQPAKLTLRDADDRLQMEFWTNFRLDRNQSFISSIFGGGGMALVALLMLAGGGRVPFFLPLFFLTVAAGFIYSLVLTAVNKTHIDMDQDAIKVTRQPFPNPLNQGHEISLAGITAIKYEETAISRKEGYDTPRYRVWAETADGTRRTIVNDVTEEYAVFIAQRLEERLQMNDELDAELDTSRLEDGEHYLDEEADVDEVMSASQKKVRH
jgi:hypothetical protein